MPGVLVAPFAGDPRKAPIARSLSITSLAHPAVRIDPGGGTAMAAETTIAANPGTGEIVAGWNDLRDSPDGFWRLGVGVSLDGGQTWSDFVVRPPAPFQTLNEGDPTVAHDPRTGNLWIAGTAFFNSFFVARKMPGAATFETPVIAYSNPSQSDKSWLTAGPPPGDPSSTHLYLAHNLGFQVSQDLGETWSAPLSLGFIISPLPRVGPTGTVYISSWEFFGSNIWLHRSFDGGATLDGPRVIATRLDVWDTAVTDHTPGKYRLPPLPGLAVDPTAGTLYCVYPDTTSVSAAEYNVDIYLTRSVDDGLTWTTPAVVNGDSDPPGDQFFPWLEVDSSGRLHMVFFDTRHTPQSDTAASGLVDVTYSYSEDQGNTWTEIRLTSSPFDTAQADWPLQGQFLGDYLGLTLIAEGALAIYPSTAHGDLDIFVQLIDSPEIFSDGFESGSLTAWSSVN